MKIDLTMLDPNVKKQVTEFSVGDTVKVIFTVKEEGVEKTQTFEGIVIAKRGRGINSTFTVRKISYGVGVERIFPLYSPMIKSIVVLERGKVRRAKLYYLREKVGKEATVKETQENKATKIETNQ